MDIVKICKDFGKALAWVAGIVTAACTIAWFLSVIFGLDFRIMIQIVALICVAGFVIFVIYHSLKHYIRKEIYEILKNEKLIKKGKGDKNEK
jgi:high-affinity Fe2+/Pb2+ permease